MVSLIASNTNMLEGHVLLYLKMILSENARIGKEILDLNRNPLEDYPLPCKNLRLVYSCHQ